MKKNVILGIFLLSMSLIAQEMTWTRIFSAEFFYTFAFLVLSLAILGSGMGALTLRLVPSLNREKLIGPLLAITGICAIIGPSLIFKLGIQFSKLGNESMMIFKLLLAILILSSAFYFGGIALALLFRKNANRMDRLYMADLIGAGSGVLVAILFMNWLGTPQASLIIVAPVLLASFLISYKWMKIFPVLILGMLILLTPSAENRLEVARQERAPVIYKHWDAMAKIKMFSYPNDAGRGLVIDNVANTPVYQFDGNFEIPEGTPKDQWGIPVGDLIRRFENCTFLSLGAGGGADVLQALMEGASEVHAVEVNPWINKMLLEGDPNGYLATYLDTLSSDLVDVPEYMSRYYEDPRVKVITEDARTYVRQHPNRFDVIYSLSSNTWSALASGSFALAENYLFTVEAYKDYWNALSDQGFMMMEHQFYMPRLVSELLIALDEMGVEHPRKHFAVYNLPKMRRNALLLSKQPLTQEVMQIALTDLSPETHDHIHLLYPAADSLKNNAIQRIVDQGWKAVAESLPVDISPVTDNRPFVAQMGMWKNFKFQKTERILPYEFFGYPLTKIIVLSILLIIVVLIVPLNLLPYFRKETHLKGIPWLYYFIIGMAFMIIEVILIQKYTLFVGPNVYAIAIILFTLLVSSGVGSRFSWRVPDILPFAGILLWILLDIVLFKFWSSALISASPAGRILITAFFVIPLGFFMGMPFPKGAKRIGDLIDWGFAVNGAASVLGSTFIILIAMAWGFNAGMILAALLYLAAYGLYVLERRW